MVEGRALLNWVVSLEEGIHGARVRPSPRGSHHPAHASTFLGTWQYGETGFANVGGVGTGFKCFHWNVLLLELKHGCKDTDGTRK